MIIYKKLNSAIYDVIYENGVKLGHLLREVDGFFVWYPPHPSNGGAWNSHIIRNIANKLDELNKEWEEFVNNNLSVPQ